MLKPVKPVLIAGLSSGAESESVVGLLFRPAKPEKLDELVFAAVLRSDEELLEDLLFKLVNPEKPVKFLNIPPAL